jgi:hypothetical protein
MPILGSRGFGRWTVSAAQGGDAYELISTATGTGSANTITFSSIPATYRHLQLRIVGRSTFANTSNENASITLNGLTSGYSHHYFAGDGSSSLVFGQASQSSWQYGLIVPQNNQQANVFSSAIIDLLDYTSTTKNKTLRGFLGWHVTSATRQIQLGSSMIATTNAITSISFALPQGNWTTTSRFSLYGIRGA